MTKINLTGRIAILLFMLNASQGMAQDKVFPVPSGNANQLFYLQRTPNINTVVYEVNYTKTGELDTIEPVHVFWIRYGEKGQRAELSGIQRHYAYGIKTKWLAKDFYELRIVAYKKRLFYMRKTEDNRYYVYTSVNNRQIMVNRIFLKINGGTFWSPNVEYIEFKGIDLVTGLEATEQIKV
ncbi:DUF4833 domain-containing protein [Ferruginibacter profundus]